MIEEDKTYPEIVQQVSAVRASLDSLTQVIVEDLVEYYIKHSRNQEANKDSRWIQKKQCQGFCESNCMAMWKQYLAMSELTDSDHLCSLKSIMSVQYPFPSVPHVNL